MILSSGNIHSIEMCEKPSRQVVESTMDAPSVHFRARRDLPSYATNLVTRWLPKVEGAEDVLNGGAVCDIGRALAYRLNGR